MANDTLTALELRLISSVIAPFCDTVALLRLGELLAEVLDTDTVPTVFAPFLIAAVQVPSVL
jgi:hypothetical protein